jgi:hypothetical protein
MDVRITLYNAIGESVFIQDLRQVQKSKVKLDLENISGGVYVCIADMKDIAIARRIVLTSR